MKKVSGRKANTSGFKRIGVNGLFLPILICLVTACAKVVHVPVEERSQPPADKINSHRVSAGETLYAIAWRYTIDPIELATINQLSKPYALKIGQRLTLDKRASIGKKTANATRLPERKTKQHRQSTQAAIKASQKQVIQAWVWPTQGKVDTVFQTGRTVHNGIDIIGRNGQAIVAAEDGVVVYAGNGLSAYGNLIIVKHRNQLLSAYAHNRRLLVVEGELVKAGEKIAEMGRSGTTKEHLHFEIRKNGQPVDPLSKLPKRKS